MGSFQIVRPTRLARGHVWHWEWVMRELVWKMEKRIVRETRRKDVYQSKWHAAALQKEESTERALHSHDRWGVWIFYSQQFCVIKQSGAATRRCPKLFSTYMEIKNHTPCDIGLAVYLFELGIFFKVRVTPPCSSFILLQHHKLLLL